VLLGCPPQQMHSDFRLNISAEDKQSNMVPYSIIIPMQEGTKLAMYEEGNIQKASYMLHIPIDNMYVGRYDCMHGGAGYDEPNTRIHIYVVPKCFNEKGEIDIEQSVSKWKEKDRVYFPPKGKIRIPSNHTLCSKWKNAHDSRQKNAYETLKKRKAKTLTKQNKLIAMKNGRTTKKAKISGDSS
jgi:hypothetical protein